MIFREHALQRGLVRLVPKVVRVPHFFACHDRGRARSEYEHVYEAQRGMRPGWPDTELCLDRGSTFRCELKAKGAHVIDGGAQDFCISKLNALGHRTTIADSAMAWCEAADRHGVPLRGNWRTLAQLEDENIAADIREQEVKQAQKAPVEAPIVKPKRRGRPTPAQIKRIFAAIKPLT